MLSKYLEIVEKGVVVVKDEEVSADDLGPNEAIIQNETSIISAGTELSRVFALKPGVTYPVRPGYATIGRILQKGSALVDYEVGERVFYLGNHASLLRFTGNGVEEWNHFFKVPEGLDSVEAPLACMIGIALTGPNDCEVKIGDSVAMFGLGVVGLLAALLYQINGARVIGLDPVESRCELAKALGIRETIACAPAEQAEAVKALTAGLGADITVDAVGQSTVIATAIQAARLYGQVVLLGSPRVAAEGNLTDIFNPIHMKMLTVRGALAANAVPLKPTPGFKLSFERNYRTAFELMLNKQIDASKIISHVIQPEQAEEAYHGLYYDKEHYRCVVIDWR
jgi:D-arabinose 1-dehydrogenase-like Zn-dependent alcohol dehydrogenase